jgi:hypothetical protein
MDYYKTLSTLGDILNDKTLKTAEIYEKLGKYEDFCLIARIRHDDIKYALMNIKHEMEDIRLEAQARIQNGS